VRQEVPDGGARRPRGLVEVDDPLLRGDQGRARRDRLRDRGEPHHARRVPPRREGLSGSGHAGGGEGDVPGVDLLQGVHRGDTTARWSAG